MFKKHKKQKSATLSFFSVVLLMFNSAIGIGVFLKSGEVLQNTDNNVGLAIIPMIIVVVGLFISVCTYSEIASATADNKEGIVGWNRKFNNNFMYQSAKSFMTWICNPLQFLVMPIYSILFIQQSFGIHIDWYVIGLVAFALALWFVVLSGLSLKAGDIQNKIITFVKFFPLIFAVFAGFICLGMGYGHVDPDLTVLAADSPTDFTHLTPFLGIMVSLPSIFFAFDGYYYAGGAQSQMKEPKRFSFALLVGMGITACFVMLIYTALLFGSSSGVIDSLAGWFGKGRPGRYIVQAAEVCIAVGSLGLVNSTSMFCRVYYRDLVIRDEIVFSKFAKKVMKGKMENVGILYTFGIVTLFYLIFIPLGSFTKIADYHSNVADLGKNINNLYSMCDLLCNWLAIIAQVVITIALAGAIRNRWTKRVKTNKSKIFLPCAFITVILITIVACTVLAQAFGDLVIDAMWVSSHAGADKTDLIGSIAAVAMLFLTLSLMFVPATIETIKEKRNKTHKAA